MTDQTAYMAFGFTDEDWGLIVGLPQSVLNAASAAQSDGARRTKAESAAGLEAIAAGRESASPLVTAVAVELVSRVGDPDSGEELPVLTPDDPEGLIGDVLARAGEAKALLDARLDEGEAGAYKHWLITIAEQVVSASPTGGVFGLGAETITDNERKFRDELAHVLSD